MRILRIIIKIFLFGILGYAIVLFIGFIGVNYGFTKVSGSVDSDSDLFQDQENVLADVRTFSVDDSQKMGAPQESEDNAFRTPMRDMRWRNACKLEKMASPYPKNTSIIARVAQREKSEVLVAKMILAASLRFLKDDRMNDDFRLCEDSTNEGVNVAKFIIPERAEEPNIFPWMNGEQWKTIETAVLKDAPNIKKAAQVAGVEPRVIVASLIVEQLRLFYGQRELYEKFFAPLKILGNATKISLGVMGIKEATAIDIERHLKDEKSPYYIGKEYENILDYQNGNVANERFARLTNDKDHYYSYLYGALYLRQFMVQWKNAGYDIRFRPEISGTLFNVGFPQSSPKSDPKVGGSSIHVGDGKYSFGSLAYEFYYSGALVEEFGYDLEN